MEEMHKERSFSVELKSKANLKNMTLNNDDQENVLIEGTIGELQHASFVEPEILEVKGRCGVLRLNVRKSEVKDTVKKGTAGDEE
ncbi:MAG: hypothetical protein OEY31_01930 [Candidatus Bathyarchaeota archaeon]|nr:hypothetical protein [Candidatus Bathyarchaeota archaeon]